MRVLVAGAGGFIGGHLVKRLLRDGHYVVAVDIKPHSEWWQHAAESDRVDPNTSNCRSADVLDLRLSYHVDHLFEEVCGGPIDQVYNLAADMGGIGFIENNKADCMVSVLINTNLIRAAVAHKVKRYFYASSACVYHAQRQAWPDATALTESDAYYNGGAMPEDGYGWEKLFSERMCRHFMEEKGIECRVARFHNVYGPHGSWCDGREKAPAAICRKVAEAARCSEGTPSIEVWGDGTQRRSFMYIDDCIEGIRRIMDSDIREPINLGSSEMVTINQLIEVAEEMSGRQVFRNYDTSKPQGVMGRNSDNTAILAALAWEPRTSLQAGLRPTYDWIAAQVAKAKPVGQPAG